MGRMERLRKFDRSDDFIRNLIIFCLSSIPSWEFSRSLKTSTDEDPDRMRGVPDALCRMVDEGRCILRGGAF